MTDHHFILYDDVRLCTYLGCLCHTSFFASVSPHVEILRHINFNITIFDLISLHQSYKWREPLTWD